MHVYFSGIGGAGIGPLALICHDAGYEVSGSDRTVSRFTKQLAKAGIMAAIGQDGSQITAAHAKQPIDWLVISSAVATDHPEIQFAKQHDIKITKRAGLLNKILKDKNLKLVAIAGTHGKTTTSAMMTWLFKKLDIPVSYSVGSNFSFGPSGAYQTDSEYFVYECDEYDRNMLEFSPELSLITIVDYDHSDTYPTKTDYNEAFERFVHQSNRSVMWQRDAEVLGLEHECTVCIDEQDPEVARIKLPGRHNRENAWLAVNAFHELFPQHPPHQLLDVISAFPGTERRFEKLAKNIYTTYSHLPGEIRADIQLARELNDHVIAVYQPHQNIRQHENLHKYGDCFNQAEHVYWLPTYLTRENPKLEILTPQQLIGHLDKPQIAEPAEMNTTLLNKLRQHLEHGDLVVFMGAGPIDDWARGHVDQLTS